MISTLSNHTSYLGRQTHRHIYLQFHFQFYLIDIHEMVIFCKIYLYEIIPYI